MSIANKSLPHESETDSCQPPRSSLTCVSSFSPVQPSSIEDLRTWLAQAFPASPSPLQESKPEPTTSGTCGQQQRTLFASYSLNPFCLRTCQDLFHPVTLDESSVIWPTWGMWEGGELSAQPTAAHHISAPASGSWATPASQWLNVPRGTLMERAASGRALPLSSQVALKSWPTPTASDHRDRGGPSTPAVQRREQIGKSIELSMRVDGALNPDWVEWLMGWPIGWTDLKPLEMVRFQAWLDAHGSA